MTTSNSEGSTILSLMATSREAVKSIGLSSAQAAIAFGVLSAAQSLAYQGDDYHRKMVVKYLASKAKAASKTDREQAKTWLHKEFELVQPQKGARAKDRFMFNNRVSRIESAFKRAVSYFDRGLRFVQDGKKVYVTAASYKKAVMPDYQSQHDIEVTTMNEKDSVTWSGLAPAKAKAAKATSATVIGASAANFAILCNATKTSAEAISAEKMAGSDTLAALNAFFALQTLLGAKEDKALLDKYDDLVKAQAS